MSCPLLQLWAVLRWLEEDLVSHDLVSINTLCSNQKTSFACQTLQWNWTRLLTRPEWPLLMSVEPNQDSIFRLSSVLPLTLFGVFRCWFCLVSRLRQVC